MGDCWDGCTGSGQVDVDWKDGEKCAEWGSPIHLIAEDSYGCPEMLRALPESSLCL